MRRECPGRHSPEFAVTATATACSMQLSASRACSTQASGRQTIQPGPEKTQPRRASFSPATAACAGLSQIWGPEGTENAAWDRNNLQKQRGSLIDGRWPPVNADTTLGQVPGLLSGFTSNGKG